MNPELLALIAEKNLADLEAIISKVGIQNLIALLPNIISIFKTIQSAQKAG